MYLTKLEIPLNDRKAAFALGDCQSMHRLICGLFETDRQKENILYRLNVQKGSIQIYLYSDHPVRTLPEQVHLSGQRDLTDWLSHMQNGDCFGFDLVASPCKKVYQEQNGKNSQRRVLREPQERLDWLRRKSDQNGFKILNVQELEQSHSRGKHSREKGGAMYLDAYHYQGTLQVTETEQFAHAVREGIGPGKAYGLGMLMLRSL